MIACEKCAALSRELLQSLRDNVELRDKLIASFTETAELRDRIVAANQQLIVAQDRIVEVLESSVSHAEIASHATEMMIKINAVVMAAIDGDGSRQELIAKLAALLHGQN